MHFHFLLLREKCSKIYFSFPHLGFPTYKKKENFEAILKSIKSTKHLEGLIYFYVSIFLCLKKGVFSFLLLSQHFQLYLGLDKAPAWFFGIYGSHKNSHLSFLYRDTFLSCLLCSVHFVMCGGVLDIFPWL